MSDITITAEPPKPITLELVGVSYTVRPIKASLGVALAQRFNGDNSDTEKFAESMKSLTTIMFGKKDAAAITKRLADPEDDLDYSHLFSLLNALVERASGNPTT